MNRKLTAKLSPTILKTIGLTALISAASQVMAGERVDKTIDTSASPKIDIEHVNGKADIRVWDKSQVRVSGELGDRTEEFIFEQRGDVVIIHVEVERNSKSWFNKGKDGDDLTIYIPSASDLHYTAVNADVSAQGVTKAADIEVVNGDVTLSDMGERIEVESVNGDIALNNVKGRLEVETVNGEIEASHTGAHPVVATSVNGKIKLNSNSPDITIETVNGRIDLSLAEVDSLKIDTVNGRTYAELSLNSKGALQASSVGGAMEFVFQKGVSAQIDLETHAGGSIVNNISDDKAKKPKYGPSRWLRFMHNGGASNVDISTVNGRIEIDEK
ncbi:hypothetical protein D210916BOD24_29560 [Alteromonas sp. D210916BOD_24]|uniref:DUF4097 family beta strand repeat-containing protein n=1 Tax=Alteromonas sp. D210916BOD_24 TaxID=3157618 RepID=UPI00399CA78E